MDKTTLQELLENPSHRKKVAPVPMDLSGAPGRRLVMNTARRVMETHIDVIRALAKR